ncbi:MAG: cyclase family protein [Alphaproteobacteria bacterium]|nr:cyclase family protein [Alphaproteobacteria bacterium]MCB9928021.1 cyclase family protein [Alphaproteobacteria bacterium]
MTNCVHDHRHWADTWGQGDQLGAGALLTPANTLQALREVQRGEVWDLSFETQMGAPAMAPAQTPFILSASSTARNSARRRRAMGATNDAGSNLERIEMTTHVGTHMDALGHFSIGEHLYGGYSVDDTVDDWGLVNLGIEHCPPIITRAVLLNVADADGEAFLGSGRAVGPDDLKRALDKAKTALRPGDVAFVRTGWGRFFMTDNAKYLSGEPGLNTAAAHWLTEQDVVAIGADNMAVEVLPAENHPEILMPVHQHCLAEAGVYLVENLALDGLAAAGISTFCLSMVPIKFKGATGSPVRPVAIV